MILDENLDLIWNFIDSDKPYDYINASDIFKRFDSDSWLIISHYPKYCVFDLHNLKKTYVNFQTADMNEPYFINGEAIEILKVNDKLIWYSREQINIINMKNGFLIKSISMSYKSVKKIEVSTDDKLVVLIKDKNKVIKIYDLNGKMTNEYEIISERSDEEEFMRTENKFMSTKLSFKLDKNNTIHILETLF